MGLLVGCSQQRNPQYDIEFCKITDDWWLVMWVDEEGEIIKVEGIEPYKLPKREL